jgi:hypothetical protein
VCVVVKCCRFEMGEAATLCRVRVHRDTKPKGSKPIGSMIAPDSTTSGDEQRYNPHLHSILRLSNTNSTIFFAII